ncbi:MAG: Hsp20/alpha crystallin family protein [Candidatus Muirbacterium halophilum]|nr:Hsp20/alpha crystallin family protein [Candidatus Muirbacterium halophilum]MCK9474963.1 Hsp20/alpha crystallin family protein [Candidatus Muirbacterium halophilum]
MKFATWNPTKEFYDMTNFVRDILDEGVTTSKREWTRTRKFPVDIFEKENEIYLEAELPGMEKQDIDITLENGYLTIKTNVQKNNEIEENKKELETRNYLFRERPNVNYSRTFEIGDGVSEEGIKAEFKNGILSLTFQKPQIKKEEVKKIQID